MCLLAFQIRHVVCILCLQTFTLLQVVCFLVLKLCTNFTHMQKLVQQHGSESQLQDILYHTKGNYVTLQLICFTIHYIITSLHLHMDTLSQNNRGYTKKKKRICSGLTFDAMSLAYTVYSYLLPPNLQSKCFLVIHLSTLKLFYVEYLAKI